MQASPLTLRVTNVPQDVAQTRQLVLRRSSGQTEQLTDRAVSVVSAGVQLLDVLDSLRPAPDVRVGGQVARKAAIDRARIAFQALSSLLLISNESTARKSVSSARSDVLKAISLLETNGAVSVAAALVEHATRALILAR